MMEHYRKRGVTVRHENGVLIEVTERGEAWIDAEGIFRAQPLAGTGAIALDSSRVSQCVRRIRAVIPDAVALERLIVSEGAMEHECEERRWDERVERVHLTLTNRGRRLQLDLACFDVVAVQRVAAAFAVLEDERPAPASVRVAPLVGAAITPLLVGGGMADVSVRQQPGTVDGRGLPVEDVEVGVAPWPNVWRPSYRVPPLSTPMQLVASHPGSIGIDHDLPYALALLEPVQGHRLHLLLEQGGRSWPAVFFLESIRAIGEAQQWYPVHAGSFGAEMVL